MTEVPRNRVLYDEAFLDDLRERHGKKATEIKAGTDTPAFVYEIRTALRYWFGGQPSYRTSDRIWCNCEAFEEGEWMLNDDAEIEYGG